jgi:Protein of unknown function (DUF1573)
MSSKALESLTSVDSGRGTADAPWARYISSHLRRSVAATVVLATLGLGSLALVGTYRFGSLASALAYLRGDRLIPDAYSKAFGVVDKGERPTVEFSIANSMERPVKILGANVSCTCLVTSGLPIVVPAYGRAALRVSARSKGRTGSYSQRLEVVTDVGELPLVLTVKGTFR